MKKESPLLVDTSGGLSVILDGKALYSTVDASSLPRRLAEAAHMDEDTLYLVPSPLAGHGLADLQKRLKPGAAILCVESDMELMALALRLVPETIRSDGRIRFVRTASVEAAVDYTHGMGRFRRIRELRFSGGWKLDPEFYASLLAGLEADISMYWRNRSTMGAMARLWLKNILSNLAQIRELNMHRISAPHINKPVLVCGAGPSLDSLRLPENHDLWPFILACDTALPALRARKILPDAIVCLEGQIHNLKDFIPKDHAHFDLFVDLSSHPSTFRASAGKRFLMATAFADLRFLDRLRRLPFIALHPPATGSVGVLAVWLALEIGSGPVFLSGLDFSFKPGMTHARHAPSDIAALLQESRTLKRSLQWRATYSLKTVPATDLSGNVILSDNVLGSYASNLEDLCRHSKRVFDLRASGLPLGVPRADYHDLANACAENPKPTLEPSGEGIRDEYAGEALSFLNAESARLENLYGLLKNGGSHEALHSALTDCDWIYCAFPDEHRAHHLAQDFLNRVLVELVYWLGRIKNAMKDLG